MIEVTVYNPETGALDSILTLASAAEVAANVAAGLATIPGHYDLATAWRNPATAAIEARPSLPVPADPYDVTAFPAGTVITIADDLGAVTVVEDLAEPIEFVDAGVYAVRVAPPFPYLPISGEVVVP